MDVTFDNEILAEIVDVLFVLHPSHVVVHIRYVLVLNHYCNNSIEDNIMDLDF